MTTKQAELIAAARLCLGTAFHHQGRQIGVGLDCIGLVVVALQQLGYPVQDQQNYGRRPDGEGLVQALLTHGACPVAAIMPADILLFRYDQQPQHVAIAIDADRMIHSFAPAGAVVETGLGAYWRRRLLAIYRFSFLQN